jgi:hypothetical protein
MARGSRDEDRGALMLFSDHLTLDAPRRTADGYLVCRAKAARTGVYQYAGAEVDPQNAHGLRDKAIVNVLRDDATVFDKKAVHSFIGKPVTNDHPTVAVSADNWRDHARGVVMGAVRDGEHLSFDLLLTDAAAIADVEGGKRELSNGYGAELEFGSFTAADGTVCEARQASIKGNHVAIVDRGRAGSECRIADAARCSSLPADVFELFTDERTYSDGSPAHKTDHNKPKLQDGDLKMPHTLIIDGLQVTEVSDQAKAAIEKLQGQVRVADEARAKAEGDVAKLTTDKSTLDAKVTTLEQQVKDAKLTPQQLRDAAKAFAQTLDTAKKLAPTATFTDAMDEPAIKRTVVSAKLGDAAKDWNDEQVAVSFDTLAAQPATAMSTRFATRSPAG